jgi:hypothetical protein
VVKTVRRRRLVDVQHRVGFGTCMAIEHVRAPLGWQSNTAFGERINLTSRQPVAAVGRRVRTRCKGEDGVRQPLAVFHCSDNFCWPHASGRKPRPQPEPTPGGGSAHPWRPCTPAMAAGLTEHVWTLREGLLCRVPPWPQPAAGWPAVGGGEAARGGGPEPGRCVHTARCEGVTRGERATGRS